MPVIILLVAIPAFLFARIIWPFSPAITQEARSFFTFVTVVESIFLGIGVSFVYIVFSKGKTVIKKWQALDWLVFVSIAWILISGYPHDNSHIAHETDVHGLILIEIFFHGTLAIAALILAYSFVKKLKKN